MIIRSYSNGEPKTKIANEILIKQQKIKKIEDMLNNIKYIDIDDDFSWFYVNSKYYKFGQVNMNKTLDSN